MTQDNTTKGEKKIHSNKKTHLNTSKSLRWVSLVVQTVKNLYAMQEARVQSLGLKDPLERGIATHSSILTWGIPWTEEPGRLQSMVL